MSSPASQTVPASIQIDGFEVEGILGRGSSSVVYLARQAHPQRQVALKVLVAPNFGARAQERYAREVELLGSVEHPHIARLYGAGVWCTMGIDYPYLVMERVQGETLSAYCEACDLPLPARLRLLAQVAHAAHFVHARGVVHRDLKPHNILVDRSGAPRILDFGVARGSAPATGEELTLPGEVVGTLPYMAPEQLRVGSGAVDLRVDVYALGVIGYELVARALPYPGQAYQDVLSTLQALVDHPPELAPATLKVPRDLRAVLARAMASDPRRRYGSALELALDLDRFLASEPVSAQPPGLAHALMLFVRRRRALALGSAVGLAGLLAAVGASLHFGLQEAAARRLAQRAEIQAVAARQLAERQANEVSASELYLEHILRMGLPADASGKVLSMPQVLDKALAEYEANPPGNPAVAIQIGALLGEFKSEYGDYAHGLPLLERVQAQAAGNGEISPRLRQDVDTKLAVEWADTPKVRQVQALIAPYLTAAPAGSDEQSRHLWVRAWVDSAYAAIKLDDWRAADHCLQVLGNQPETWFVANDIDIENVLIIRLLVNGTLGRHGQMLDEIEALDASFARTWGPASQVRVIALYQAAFAADALHRPERAAALAARALQAKREQVGDDAANTLEIATLVDVFSLATAPQDRGRLARMREHFARLERVAGPHGSATLAVKGRVALALLDSRSAEGRREGERLLREVYGALRQGAIAGRLKTLAGLLPLGAVLTAAGQAADADAFYREVCGRLARDYADHPATAACQRAARDLPVP